MLAHQHDTHTPFGSDTFGRAAERFARFFGTPRFIIGQTILVALWIAVNSLGIALGWDPYPFILLNLAFSTQAAYAAPLILLAQTRQADRDKQQAHADVKHREQLHAQIVDLIGQNTRLTTEIHSIVERRQEPRDIGQTTDSDGGVW